MGTNYNSLLKFIKTGAIHDIDSLYKIVVPKFVGLYTVRNNY